MSTLNGIEINEEKDETQDQGTPQIGNQIGGVSCSKFIFTCIFINY